MPNKKISEWGEIDWEAYAKYFIHSVNGDVDDTCLVGHVVQVFKAIHKAGIMEIEDEQH